MRILTRWPLWIGALLLLGGVGLYFFSPLVITTYSLPSNAKAGWYAIEYANPRCPWLVHNRIWQKFSFDDSNYLCTSNEWPEEWQYERFYLAGDDYNELLKQNRIHGGSGIRSWSNCRVRIYLFWYGPKDDFKLAQDQHAYLRELMHKYHPEC